MKTKEAIDEQVTKTLELMEQLPKASADAFFYTRLSARLERQNEPTVFNWFFDIPMLKPAFIVLFIFLNLVSLVHWVNQYQSVQTQPLTATEELIEEYSLNQTTNSYLVFNEE